MKGRFYQFVVWGNALKTLPTLVGNLVDDDFSVSGGGGEGEEGEEGERGKG